MKLTGMQFRFKDDPWCRTCVPNKYEAVLAHDKDNKFDDKAMGVWLNEGDIHGAKNHLIGYLTAARNTTFQEENDRDWGFRNLKEGNITSVKVVGFFHKTPSDGHAVIDEKGEFVKAGNLFNKRGLGSLNSVTVEFETKEDDGEVADRSVSNMMGITRFLSLLPCDEEGQERFDRWKFGTLKDVLQEKTDDLMDIVENGYDHYRSWLQGLADSGTEMHSDIEGVLNRWESLRKEGKEEEFEASETDRSGIYNFILKYQPKVMWIEKNVQDKEAMLRGRPDCLLEIEIGGETVFAVVDWKSGRCSLKHKLQVSFYAKNSEKKAEGWVVSFKTDSKQGYSLTRVDVESVEKNYSDILSLKSLCESLGIIK